MEGLWSWFKKRVRVRALTVGLQQVINPGRPHQSQVARPSTTLTSITLDSMLNKRHTTSGLGTKRRRIIRLELDTAHFNTYTYLR